MANKGAESAAVVGNPGQRGSAAALNLGETRLGDKTKPDHSPAVQPQQPTAVKPATEAAASKEPPPVVVQWEQNCNCNQLLSTPFICRRWGCIGTPDQCLLPKEHLGPCVTQRGQTLPLYYRMPGV